MRLQQRGSFLDFHTMPAVPDVGADFDGDEFAATLADAHADFVTVCAKCNLGMAYYPTKVGITHPSLQKDMIGEMIEACHRKGIGVGTYFNAGLDHEMARQHREWVQLDQDGRAYGEDRLNHFFRPMCFASPWADQLSAIIEEVLSTYEVDGILLDCFLWNRACYGDECLSQMRDQGLDVSDHVAVADAQNQKLMQFVRRVRQLLDQHRPEATFYMNGIPPQMQKGVGSHIVLESLPNGGWGYMDFPWKIRHRRKHWDHVVRQTGRFHRSWADFGGLRTQAALDFDCLQAISQAAACEVGDHMHPRGRLDAPVYKRVGSIFKRIEALEPWTKDAKPVTDTGVVIAGLQLSNVELTEGERVALGATRAMEQLRQQFDILDDDADWSGYRTLVLVDPLPLDDVKLAKVQAHLHTGGSILATGSAGLLADSDQFPPEWGVEYLGPDDSDPGYFIVEDEHAQEETRGMPVSLTNAGVKISANKGTQVLAQSVRPYFNRHWDGFHGHVYLPPDQPTGTAAMTHCGKVAHIAFSVFRDFAEEANPAHQELVGLALSKLNDQPLVKVANAPSFARVTLTAQQDRLMVHVLSYVPEQRGRSIDVIEEPIILRDVGVSVLCPSAKRVYLAPQNEDIPWQSEDVRIEFEIPQVHGYQLVVIE